jgi:hypothetical protein
MTWFQFNFSLLNVLLDHWRPKTHTFHFTIRELTPTLRDTSLLMGLPCEGEPMEAVDISDHWSAEFLARFANVPQNNHAPPRTKSSRTLTDPP